MSRSNEAWAPKLEFIHFKLESVYGTREKTRKMFMFAGFSSLIWANSSHLGHANFKPHEEQLAVP
jgi:hypothetical protein